MITLLTVADAPHPIRLLRRATTGHAAALPSPAMKSRRRIGHLLRWIRGAYLGRGCIGTG